MTVLHWYRNGADTVGTTTGSKESIGSYQIPSKADAFHGWVFQDGSTATTTAAEATQGKFIVDSPEITRGTQTFLAGTGSGAASATNISSVWDPGAFVLYDPKRKDAYRNATITYEYDTAVEMTQENYAQVFTMWSSQGVTPDHIFRNRGNPLHGLNSIIKHSYVAADVDIGNLTSEVFAQTITLPSDAVRIVACMVSFKSDAMNTAGEHAAGYIEVTSTLTGIEPQYIPLPLNGGSLGTPVDWPDNGRFNWIYPMYIDLTQRAAETFTFTARLAATTSGVYEAAINLFAI